MTKSRIERSDIISDEAIAEIKRLSEILIKVPYVSYRIVEYDGKFTIQKRRTVTTETGMLWWKKTDERILWNNVDEHGNCVYYHHSCLGSIMFGGDLIDPLNSLKEAKDKIKVFSKGETIHYL